MPNIGHRRQRLLLLALAALLWQALHPLAAPLLARAQAAAAGEPFAEICSTLGIKRLPLVAATAAADAHAAHAGASASSAPSSAASSATTTPAAPGAHGDSDHCPWCRLAGVDLAPAPVARPSLPAVADAGTPPASPAAIVPAPLHRPQHARGPPILL